MLFLENGSFFLQLHYAVVKFGFLQEVCIAGEDGDKFRKVHAVILVHAVFINTSHCNSAVVNLIDEHLLIFKQIELVGIKRFLCTIHNHIYRVVAPEFNGITFTDSPAVSLLHISRSPRYLKMMHRNGSFLCIYACT